MSTPPASRDSLIALIGCGAIAESFYLPALSAIPGISDRLILVDLDDNRRRAIAERFGVSREVSDFRDVLPTVSRAIVAVPHHLHYPIAMELLQSGIHVLCEKPLAATAPEARTLVEAAEKKGLVLQVNNTRRLWPNAMTVHTLLRQNRLGALRSLTYYDGAEFNWPTASGFYFDSAITPRGVLLDIGAHVLDLICWWLQAKPTIYESRNDSFGGPEAVAGLRLEHGGCICDVRLSRLAKLANEFHVVGEHGEVRGGVYNLTELAVRWNNGKWKTLKVPARRQPNVAQTLVTNFLDAASQNADPLIPGRSVLASIELIDEGYRKAARYAMPWYGE
jgi:predicted dehydrogenase